MLQQGVRARPSGHSMERLVQKLQNRIMNPDASTPLQIVGERTGMQSTKISWVPTMRSYEMRMA